MVEDLEPTFSLQYDQDQERSTCSSKIRYATKARAREARNILRRTYPTADHYQCITCGRWHVTKMRAEDDRRNRRRAREGDLVTITYDAADGVTLHAGDGLQTPSGRTYRIVVEPLKVNGKYPNRYKLACAVNVPILGATYPLVWYDRSPKRKAA